MSTLLAELEKLKALVETMPRKRIVPREQDRPTFKALTHVLKTWDVAARPTEDRLVRTRREVLAAQRSGRPLKNLPPAVLRDGIWLLWPAAKDGIDRDALQVAILDRVGSSKSMLRRLIDAWLIAFDPDDDTFVAVGRRIDRHLAAPQAGLLAYWKEAHKSYDIFDAVAGPGRIADRLLKDSSGRLLAACRLDAPARASSGYLRAVHYRLSAALPQAIRGDQTVDPFERATRFYAPDGKLRFDEPGPNGAMADGLVGAWLGGQRQPSDRMRDMVLTFLRQHLGDPRVDHQHRWARASTETRQRVRTWLSALSLDAFFNVVGHFAGSAGKGKQWAAREAFWSACLKGGYITDSWLILGENAARAVSDREDLRGSYGRLKDPLPNRSVLLIQIGDLVFSEWTYDGKLRAWRSGWKTAPKLFLPRYDRSDVIGDGLQFPRPLERPDLDDGKPSGIRHDPGEIWQGRTAALLLRDEGIIIRSSEWRFR